MVRRTTDAKDTGTRHAARHAAGRNRRIVRSGLALSLGAAAVLLSVAAHRAPYFANDVLVTRYVQAADAGAFALPMHALNALGFPPLVDFVYGGILLLLLVAGCRWEAAAGGFGALGSAGLNAVVKHIVNRPRPSAQLVHVEHVIGNPSYPAGHVLNFTVFAGFLCYIVYLRMPQPWPRNVLLAVLVAMIALMGVARIASGEHWPSDVLGGYLLGALWLAATVRFYAWGRRAFLLARRNVAGRRPHGLLIALLLTSSPALASAAAAAPAAPESLGASTGAPWNPPHAMARRRAWEEAVLLPGRIVSLPLSGLGRITDNLLFSMEQNPRFAAGFSTLGMGGGMPVRFRTARMGDRTGLGGAAEVHQDILHGAFASTVSAEYAATLHKYDRTLVTWSGRPMSIQYGYEWRPADQFYGVGNRAPEGDQSDYASQGEFVRGGLAWESNRNRDPARAHSTLGLWGGPRTQVTRTGRERGETSYQARYAAPGAAMLDERVENLVYGASVMLDQRTGAPHWSGGWRARLSAERFDAPVHALALQSGASPGVQFTRYQAGVETGISFMRDPRSVRLMLRMASQQAGTARDRMLVSDLSTLGGQAGLGGYSPGRFHDLDLLLTRFQYVFPLQRHFEMELHSEWGAVYPDLWSDARLNTLHNSIGLSLRVRDEHAPRASLGLDFSREAVRIRYSIGGLE